MGSQATLNTDILRSTAQDALALHILHEIKALDARDVVLLARKLVLDKVYVQLFAQTDEIISGSDLKNDIRPFSIVYGPLTPLLANNTLIS